MNIFSSSDPANRVIVVIVFLEGEEKELRKSEDIPTQDVNMYSGDPASVVKNLSM